MAYVPKSDKEILRDLRGMILGRTAVNDILAGSVLNTLLSAVAQEIASAERRLLDIRESFFLRSATGTDLDERVAELPPIGITRLNESNASGSAMFFRRADSAGNLLIPAGSLVSTETGVQFKTVNDAVILNGDFEIDNVQIVALIAGTESNVGIGEINTIVSLPADVIEARNTQALSNGTDSESDEDLRDRAYLYLQSLARCQKSALEFLALTFVSSSGDKMKFAKIFEDAEKPAYSELVVDDGSGLNINSVSIAGSTTGGTIPSGGTRILFHQAPATAPITTANLTVTRGGVAVAIQDSDIISLPERGLCYLKDTVIQAGDLWQIANYRVYQGFISELQKEIEGNVNNTSVLTGFRACGTRVVVTIADSQFINFDMALSVDFAENFNVIENRVRTVLTQYINNLAPSETLYISALVEVSREINGVTDVIFYVRNSEDRLQNIYTSTPRSAIRVRANSITISAIREV